MTDPRPSYERAALVACLCLVANGCRSDAGSLDARGRTAGATEVLPSGTAAQAGAAEARAGKDGVMAPHAAAPSAGGGGSDADCAGARHPAAPLPHFEQRKLASVQEGRYKFELAYPVFHEESENVAQKLNLALAEHLGTIQKRFVKEAEAEARVPEPDNARWFEGKCEVAYHSPSFASVTCDTMEGPGAHPNLDKFAVNFQICPEVRKLALADLCRSLPECRKKIIELINEDFRTGQKKEAGIQFRDASTGTKGGSAAAEQPVATLRVFGVTPAGLRIYLFDELPHVLQAFGIVDIPAAKVRAVMRDEMARRIWGP